MPTQTFFNLPEEKRERIIQAAIQEFATYPFSQASIARIIGQAGIPRGSFYQYFENLKDLYKYVFNLAVEQKIQYFEAQIPDWHGEGFNFFDTLHRFFVVGNQFAQEHPELLALGDRFLKESDLKLKEEVLAEQSPKSRTIYLDMLERGLKLGQVDPAVDLTAALLLMQAMNTAITDAYLTLSQADSNVLTDGKYLDLIDGILYLLANGLKNKDTQE